MTSVKAYRRLFTQRKRACSGLTKRICEPGSNRFEPEINRL
ncbi:hypothetical protein CsSME_00014639 [Camellia sinensis var. sinensis]